MQNIISKEENPITEEKTLLYYLGIGKKDDKVPNIGQLTASDWEKLIQKAKQRKVAAILFYNLSQNGEIDLISKKAKFDLRKNYLSVLSKNVNIYKELAKLLRRLNDEGIPVIVLKGAALAELVYENIALRPMVDIDLIAKSSDIERINQIFLELNWENQEYLSQSGFHEEFSKHANYTNGKVFIEIHPRIYEFPNLDPWLNAVSAKICSNDTFILGKEDFLLHLCLHLEEHYRTGLEVNLIWYIDIAKFLEHYQEDINWDYFIKKSKELKVEGIIHSILHEIKQNFNGSISDHTLNQFGASQSNLSIENVFSPISKPIKYFNALMSEISGPKNATIKNRFFVIFRNIFPHKAYMVKKYDIKNQKFFYLYYFVRVFKGIKKFLDGIYHLPSYLKRKKN
jgi:hypothetical protein